MWLTAKLFIESGAGLVGQRAATYLTIGFTFH
jgi:hypothetical protein